MSINTEGAKKFALSANADVALKSSAMAASVGIETCWMFSGGCEMTEKTVEMLVKTRLESVEEERRDEVEASVATAAAEICAWPELSAMMPSPGIAN